MCVSTQLWPASDHLSLVADLLPTKGCNFGEAADSPAPSEVCGVSETSKGQEG